MLETYFRLTRGKIGRMPDASDDARLREALVPRGRRGHYEAEARAVAGRGLAVGMLAEASWRLAGNRVLLTPAAAGLAQCRFDQLLVAAPGEPPANAPPAAAWHLALYAKTSAGAALVSQPAATMALLATGVAAAPETWPAAAQLLGGPQIIAPGAVPETDPFQDRNFLLLAAFGLFTWGESLDAAAAVAETVERWSEISRLHQEEKAW